MQRLLYAASVLHCLPVGRSEEHVRGHRHGDAHRALDGYAAAAGFAPVEVLPVDHDMFRFYRLGSRNLVTLLLIFREGE